MIFCRNIKYAPANGLMYTGSEDEDIAVKVEFLFAGCTPFINSPLISDAPQACLSLSWMSAP